jgi:hypothetical protein
MLQPVKEYSTCRVAGGGGGEGRLSKFSLRAGCPLAGCSMCQVSKKPTGTLRQRDLFFAMCGQSEAVIFLVARAGEPLHKVAPTPTPAAPATPAETAAAATPQQQPPSTVAAGRGQPAPPPGKPSAAAAADADAVLPFAVVDPGESHVLRPYWEYLCYIFR